MPVTLRNGDRLRVLAAIGGGVSMERARKVEGGWAKAYVAILPHTLATAGWTPLKVLRRYRYVLDDILVFGVAGHTIEVKRPSILPLGSDVTVYENRPNPPR